MGVLWEEAALRALSPAAAKDEGNRLFKLGRLERAAEHYEWGAQQLDQAAVDGELEDDDKDEDAAGGGGCGGGRGGRMLLVTCHANVAAVRLRQEKWAAADTACGVALTHLATKAAAAAAAVKRKQGNDKNGQEKIIDNGGGGGGGGGGGTGIDIIQQLEHHGGRDSLATAVKVYFRRGQARERLGDAVSAAADFRAGAAAAESLVRVAVERQRRPSIPSTSQFKPQLFSFVSLSTNDTPR